MSVWRWGEEHPLPHQDLTHHLLGLSYHEFLSSAPAACLTEPFSLKKKKKHLYLFFKMHLFILAILCSMWDLNSLIRDWICAPCIGSADHQEVLNLSWIDRCCGPFLLAAVGQCLLSCPVGYAQRRKHTNNHFLSYPLLLLLCAWATSTCGLYHVSSLPTDLPASALAPDSL